jgi:hypothetical protein
MDLYQFNRCDIHGRASIIWKEGVFIEYRDQKEYRVILYDMRKFYAELWYDSEMNHIQLARGFKKIVCLDPYLMEIKLEDLMV